MLLLDMVKVLVNVYQGLKILFVLLLIKLKVDEVSEVSEEFFPTVAPTLASTAAILGPNDAAPLEEVLVKLTRLDKCFSNAYK